MSTNPSLPVTGFDGSRPVALIVDDVVDNRRVIRSIVERKGFEAVEASNGETALDVARNRCLALVLLDIEMPDDDGFEVLESLHHAHPLLPVVVVTASEDPTHGERVMKLGAVNFIRAPFDPQEMEFVVERIRVALEEQSEVIAAHDLIGTRTTTATLHNDIADIAPLVTLLGRELSFHYPGRVLPITELRLALYEALANAIEHGNLEIGYDGKTRALDSREGLHRLIEERRRSATFRDRRVHVRVEYGPEKVRYRVSDEGPGFKRNDLETTYVENEQTALHGRGLLLIRHYVDGVEWNDSGNEICLTVNVPEPVSETSQTG